MEEPPGHVFKESSLKCQGNKQPSCIYDPISNQLIKSQIIYFILLYDVTIYLFVLKVTLVFKLLNQALKDQSKLIEVFKHDQHPWTQSTSIPPNQQSPSKSAPKVLSSVASSGQPENQDTTTLSVSSPADVQASAARMAPPDKEDTDKLKLSLWLQWTLQKFCFSLYGGADPMKISCEVEDLTTSFDLQGVYSKVTCKVGSLNVNHYTQRLVKFTL